MKTTLVLLLLIFSMASYGQKRPTNSNAFNPDIGVNALFLNQISDRDKTEDGMKLQEMELLLSSDVDAYFTTKATLAIAQEAGEWRIEPEEIYAETTHLPSVIVRFGKAKMPLGKHNQLHSHAFPFINAPLVNDALFGEEGLNETGMGISGLLPISWFSEWTLDYIQGENTNLFNSDQKSSKTVVGRFKNLWDLNDSTTIEFGISGAQGKNSDHLDTNVYGLDFSLKWRPIQGGKYHSIAWITEYLEKDRQGAVDGKLSGIVSHIKYQFAQRWYALYRYDYLGLNDDRSDPPNRRNTALLTFLPSEFSGVRVQYENIEYGSTSTENRITMQLSVSFGAHPAHSY